MARRFTCRDAGLAGLARWARVALLFAGLAITGTASAGVDDPDTVDAIQALPGKPQVYMVIVQDRAWDAETHVMLGNKLSGYLRYALGGQLVRDTPEAGGKPVRIVLVHAFDPSAEDSGTLTVLASQVAAAGLELVWGGETDLLDMVDGE